MFGKIRSFLLALSMATLLAGCAAAVYVPDPPPARKTEARPAKPGPRYTWMEGHWKWNGHRYVWVSGKWMKAKAGKNWVPGHWKNTPRGHVWVAGHWK